MTRRKMVAGNWKMNGLAESSALLDAVAAGSATAAADVDVVICPPATLLAGFAARAGSGHVRLGGQTCHAAVSGAHTGDVSAEMLADAGAAWVIVGHSERRADHGETDADVKDKAIAAHRAGLGAIICIGETEAERDAGRTLDVTSRQLAESAPEAVTAANTVIAYEPVWAIGTGRTPSEADIVETHAALRNRLRDLFGDADDIRLLYGGSVKPANAASIFALENVDGGLIGGASLKAEDFLAIIAAARGA